jgi:hypothetical protein
LKSIHRFSSTADAVEDLTAVADGKLSKGLKRFLVDEIQAKAKKGKEQTLVVADPKLGMLLVVSSITSDLKPFCVGFYQAVRLRRSSR